MRRLFADLLFEEMKINHNIVLLTADLGYKMWDQVRDTLPNQFYNVGSAEQLLVGAGVGLALSGKIPVLYSITPFLLYRPFELIRNYLNHEKIPVKLVGSGRDKDYNHDGFSHWAENDGMEHFQNIIRYYPKTDEEVRAFFWPLLYNKQPAYMNLRR